LIQDHTVAIRRLAHVRVNDNFFIFFTSIKFPPSPAIWLFSTAAPRKITFSGSGRFLSPPCAAAGRGVSYTQTFEGMSK